jgi:hypothetical protein
MSELVRGTKTQARVVLRAILARALTTCLFLGGVGMLVASLPVANAVTVTAIKGHTSTITNSHFRQGQQTGAAFTIDVTNNGPGSTSDPDNMHPLQVVDSLNAAFTHGTLPTGTPWDCTATGQLVVCNNHSSIPAGSSYPTLTIPVTVANNAAASATNSASVSGAGITATITNTDTVTIDPAPILGMTKSHSGTFTQGATATWTIQIANNSGTAAGATDGSAVTMTDTLPTGYTLSSVTGTNWNCSSSTQQMAICTSSAVVAGSGGSFPTISLLVNVPANSPTSASNTAKVYGGGDLNHTSAATAATGSDTVSVTQVPATITINAGATQQAMVNTAFGTSMAVTVKDAGGVVIPSSSVTYTAPSSNQSGTFAATLTNVRTVSTNASGIANPGTFTANSQTGSYTTVVTDGAASAVMFNLSNVSPPAFTSASSATFTAGNSGNFNVTVSGFPAPTISLTSSSLPSGIMFGIGTLGGTPALNAFGTYPLTFTASNGVGSNATQNFNLIVNPSAQDVKSRSTISAKAGGGFHLAFIGNPGTQYTVQYVGFLPATSPQWNFISFQTASANGTFSIDDTPPAGTTVRFYRAIIP